ncbi:MAG: TetR/AcrR family transcriptional regulator [Acidimicrobiia bacterium]
MTVDQATVRLPLSRDRIVSAAVELADDQGIEALSMRKLGQALGVEAMSLYNHVEDKDDILSGMVDWLFAQIGPLDDTADWKVAVRHVAVRAKDVFTAHAWTLPLISAQGIAGPAAFGLMDSVLARLLGAGYPTHLVLHAWHVIASHVMGYSFQETTSVWASDEALDRKKRALLEGYADRFPHVSALAEELMACSFVEEFEFGLDIILSGIEAARDTT